MLVEGFLAPEFGFLGVVGKLAFRNVCLNKLSRVCSVACCRETHRKSDLVSDKNIGSQSVSQSDPLVARIFIESRLRLDLPFEDFIPDSLLI